MKKKILARLLSVLLVLAGIGLMFYPWISNYLYDHNVDSTVNVYQNAVAEVDQDEIDRLMQEAEEYNRELSKSHVMLSDPFILTDDSETDLVYEDMLSMDDTGIMCFVEIPKIDVYLPVFHGTSAEVLAKGVGHLEGSALPIGGEGNRPILSAHTGINSSKMFSDLTALEEGDLFFIHVLDQQLAYRVIRIEVIEPEDTSKLLAEEGRDLVSLLTCTPYGVNTHRLVVTGARTEYSEAVVQEAEKETSDTGSQWMQAYRKALVIGVAIVLAGIISGKVIRKVKGYRRRRRKEKAAQRRAMIRSRRLNSNNIGGNTEERARRRVKHGRYSKRT